MKKEDFVETDHESDDLYPWLFSLSGDHAVFDDDGPDEGSAYSLDSVESPPRNRCAAHYRDPTRYYPCMCDVCEQALYPPVGVINLTLSDSESELEIPELEVTPPEAAAFSDSNYGYNSDSFMTESPLPYSRSVQDSPSFSPSSLSMDEEHVLHVNLPCWHTSRVSDGNEIVSVIDDRRGLGSYECLECCLHWRHRHHALAHFRSDEHKRRQDFLGGDPMIYCMVCNRLPVWKDLHESSREHTHHLAALGRAALPTDCALRQVYKFADGRLRAHIPAGYTVDF